MWAAGGSRAGGQLGNPDLPILRPNCTAAATQPADYCTAVQCTVKWGSICLGKLQDILFLGQVESNPLRWQSFRLLTFFLVIWNKFYLGCALETPAEASI